MQNFVHTLTLTAEYCNLQGSHLLTNIARFITKLLQYVFHFVWVAASVKILEYCDNCKVFNFILVHMHSRLNFILQGFCLLNNITILTAKILHQVTRQFSSYTVSHRFWKNSKIWHFFNFYGLLV